MKNVTVLLSTYNGEKYINEQIESLLSQTYKNIKIIIRDDGSKDETVNILLKYKEKFPEKIYLYLEENIGVVKSFFKLILIAEENSDYYCLCDQDDYWLPIKIEKAIESLEKKNNRLGVYFSNLTLVNSNLEFICKKFKKKVEPRLQNAIFSNDLYGCTCLFTKEYLQLLKKGIEKIDSSKILLHDFFIYIVGNIFSEVIYDENSYILYRQHDNNVSGAHLNILGKIKKLWKRYGANHSIICNQIKEIERVYQKDITFEKNKIISEKLLLKKSLLKRVLFLLKKDSYNPNSKLHGRIIFMIIILLNRF